MLPTRNDLIRMARHAGGLLREGYGKPHAVNHKGRIDLVTEMDGISEAYLVGEIHKHFPGHLIDSEESGVISGQEAYTWYIDPLDGTTNYAHHLPIFSVSMAFAAHGQVLYGVVYDPMREECFSAELGQGAWLNEDPIRVSTVTELVDSLLITGFPYENAQANLENFAHFTHISQGVRRMGSAALDLCSVACGRVDGYWEITLKAWDILAGALIVTEAGGVATRLDGTPDLIHPPYSILAGNPAIHTLMLKEFKFEIK